MHIVATIGATLNDFESARPANEESMEQFRRLEDQEGTYLAMGTAGLIALREERHQEGLSLLGESAECALEAADHWLASCWLGFAATVALALKDGVRARSLAERALSLGRQVGARETIFLALPTLATIARSESDLVGGP